MAKSLQVRVGGDYYFEIVVEAKKLCNPILD